MKPTQDASSYVPPVGKPTAVICDIDGTLAHMANRSPYDWQRVGDDTLDPVIANLLDLIEGEHVLILVSGRDSVCRKITEEWLETHDIDYDHLYMRPENDNRKDVDIKREIFDEYIRDYYRIEFVLDDRDQVVKMWRDMGLKVLQVAPGDF